MDISVADVIPHCHRRPIEQIATTVPPHQESEDKSQGQNTVWGRLCYGGTSTQNLLAGLWKDDAVT